MKKQLLKSIGGKIFPVFNVWGINLYPEKSGEAFIEFDSMVNLKPAYGNRTRGVENNEVREKIINIVNKFVLK